MLSTCIISMWSNDIKCKYMFMLLLNNLARKGFCFCFRLWLTPRKDHNKIGEQLGYLDFIPDKNDTFHSLVNKANKKIDKGGIEGKEVYSFCHLMLYVAFVAVDVWDTNNCSGSPWALTFLKYLGRNLQPEVFGIGLFTPLWCLINIKYIAAYAIR